MANPQRLIDSKHTDCRSADGCQSFQCAFVPRKMFGPGLSSRVEQRVQNIGLGIVSRWIWTFVQTTRGAAECKVLNDRRAIVFLWTDVVAMERARIVVLRKLTVFTTTVCSFPDLLTSRGRHVYPLPLLPERCSDSRAFA